MNIYMPDDLAAQIKQLGGINVSAVCQEAVREEIEKRQEETDRHRTAQRREALREAFARFNDDDDDYQEET